MKFQNNLQKAVGGGMLKNRNNLKKAFSLIELSIVLIIIGLLVAGITGGASLIESARRTALINEMDSYKKAALIFVTEKGRYPGDLDNVGKFGRQSGITYTESSFGAPYDGETYSIPLAITAPFIDLYLSQIIDFQPKNTVSCDYDTCGSLKGVPYSKVLKKFSNYYENLPATGKNYITFHDVSATNNLKIIKKIDEKVDDGVKDTGNFTSICSAFDTYEDVISNNGKCWAFYWFVAN